MFQDSQNNLVHLYFLCIFQLNKLFDNSDGNLKLSEIDFDDSIGFHSGLSALTIFAKNKYSLMFSVEIWVISQNVFNLNQSTKVLRTEAKYISMICCKIFKDLEEGNIQLTWNSEDCMMLKHLLKPNRKLTATLLRYL